MLRQAESRATDLLTSHRRELTNLVDLLLEQETVDGVEVYRLAGRPAPTEWSGETVAPRRVAMEPLGPQVRAADGGSPPVSQPGPSPSAGS